MEVLGRLASAVIHDLNNLLTVIQLNAALIESGGFEPDEVGPAAMKIGEASQRAAELTRKVLRFARREPEESRDLKVGELLDGLVRLLDPLIARRVEVEIINGPGESWVCGNRSAIEQAILNLVLNAVDAMPSGGTVTLSCTEEELGAGEVADCAAGKYVVVRVTDRGVGIPLEDRDKVFVPFFTNKSTGTGMGLSIVQRVAELHRGAVEFDTEIGRGTEFRIWLPAAETPLAETEPGGDSLKPELLSGTVLLVEDDAGIRSLTRHLLEADGLRVLVAATGEEALEIWRARGGEIDLLFTDLVLPGELSGRDVALEILKDRPALPVLYTSGYSSAWGEESFFSAANFLAKPFVPEELRRAITAALAGS